MHDPNENVVLEVTLLQLWYLYHRLNQTEPDFWSKTGRNDLTIPQELRTELVADAIQHSNQKSVLWKNIDAMLDAKDINAYLPISRIFAFEPEIEIAGKEVEFYVNGDISVGCTNIEFELLEDIYNKAVKTRREQ